MSITRSYRETVLDIFGATQAAGRLPGSPGDRWVEEYLAFQLEGLGLEVHVDTYTARGWFARHWRLEVYEGNSWREVPSYYMARTRPGVVEGRLAWIGDMHTSDLDGDVANSIVVGTLLFPSLDISILSQAALNVSDPMGDLSRQPGKKPSVFMTRTHPSECGCPVDPEAYEASVKAGASAVVAVLGNYPDMGCGRFTYYAPSDGVFRPLPGLWVPGNRLQRIRRYAEDGRRARLELEAWEGDVEGRNVYAVIPGKGDETVIVHSHHDAPHGGAVQDASGVALVLELARYFSRVEETPERTLIFLFTEGHFDSGSGQLAFLDSHPELAGKIVADIALEHIALEYIVEDNRIKPSGRPEPRAIFASEDNKELIAALSSALEAYKPRATLLLPTNTILGVPSDANRFWRRGISVASLISGPVYMFSECDTPEKVDYDSVEPLFNVFKHVITKLSFS